MKFMLFLVNLLIIANLSFAIDYTKPQDFDHSIGKSDAKVTIIAYTSLSCPHCTHFYNDTFPVIKQKFIETGKVRYISRSIITDRICFAATMLLECNKDDYFMTIMTLAKHSNSWVVNEDYLDKLEKIAALMGISKEKFTKCLENKDIQDNLIKHQKAATEQLKIQGIPYILINGEKYDGKIDIEFLSEAITKKL